MGDLRALESKTPALQNPALLFDLDGTLIDTAYEHALAWSSALRAAGRRNSIYLWDSVLNHDSMLSVHVNS